MASPYHKIPLLLALALGCQQPSAVQRALSASHQRDEERALSILRERLQKAPDDHAARKLLVRLLAAGGRVPEALTELEALAARLDADDPSAELERGHLLELLHRFDEALLAYDRAAALAPRDPRGPREGGVRAAHWGEAEQALPRLLEAERRGANDADFYHALGAVQAKLGDRRAALRAYEALTQIAPDRLEGPLGTASVALAQRDHQAALVAYDALLQLRPQSATYTLARAYCLARLGRKDEARTALMRARELGASGEHLQKIAGLL